VQVDETGTDPTAFGLYYPIVCGGREIRPHVSDHTIDDANVGWRHSIDTHHYSTANKKLRHRVDS
jgi:hypothetical protein